MSTMVSRYIPGSAGPCYVSLYLPKALPVCWVICFPPFAEEMNKCRSMMSAQARALADVGVAVVFPDLYGTGDSHGDFGDADWEVWCADMMEIVAWMRGQGAEQVCFWGVRLGCLLAAEVASRQEVSVNHMLFWQPVVKGQQALVQFLRLRMAASMMDGAQEKVGDLRVQLERGDSLEVAGYRLSPGLAEAIDELALIDMMPGNEVRVTWLDVSGSPDKPLSVASRKIIEAWQQSGLNVEAETVVGEPFWTTQEVAMAPGLIQRTCRAFTDETPEAGSRLLTKPESLPSATEFGEQSIPFDCGGEA
ncbi:MAG: hydrolase 2, exosortase A system-associated, partial [Gammaproteobacteria bacterium]|nr:hydrolase 2, exosortase A system-associated [Gammaproteobacteria bacterium]